MVATASSLRNSINSQPEKVLASCEILLTFVRAGVGTYVSAEDPSCLSALQKKSV